VPAQFARQLSTAAQARSASHHAKRSHIKCAHLTTIHPYDEAGRRFLVRALATGSLAVLPNLAQGQGVREVSGWVWIDGERATTASRVTPTSVVESSDNARITFTINRDAFLVCANSRVHFSSSDNIVVRSARLLTGALMGVFGGGDHILKSDHMTAGIRGTGVYLEADRDQTYFCLC
jgi:hypothetical protein